MEKCRTGQAGDFFGLLEHIRLLKALASVCGLSGLNKYLQFIQQRKQSPMVSFCCSGCTATHALVQ